MDHLIDDQELAAVIQRTVNELNLLLMRASDRGLHCEADTLTHSTMASKDTPVILITMQRRTDVLPSAATASA